MNKQQNLLIHFHKEGLFLVLKNTKISDYILEEKSQQLPVMNRIHQEINNSKRILNCILQVQLRHQVHGGSSFRKLFDVIWEHWVLSKDTRAISLITMNILDINFSHSFFRLFQSNLYDNCQFRIYRWISFG